jgi:hypothetical protein
LIFGVIFYEYIPNTKIVPSTVEAYETSNTIKDEINQEVANYTKQNIYYEITDSDLTLYQKADNYNSGKSNPFSPAQSTTENATVISGNSQVVTSNTTKNPDSTDYFFNNTSGLK